MQRGSLVELDGVYHMIRGVRGVKAWGATPVTYCGLPAMFKLEAQTSLITCVACLATRAYAMARWAVMDDLSTRPRCPP